MAAGMALAAQSGQTTTQSGTQFSGQSGSAQQSLHHQAAEWGLTEEEWQRYERLRNGRRGIQSPAADPVTLLGLEARSPQERRRYAEMLVRQEKTRVEAELALQREYDAAWKRLWPDLMRIGTASSRLAVFVRTDCGSTCNEIVARVIEQQRPADFWLVDSGGDDAVVRRWAAEQHIPAALVQAGTLTLNHDNGHWLTQGQGRMPAVLQQKEGKWVPAVF
ncbi:TPA: TIGR03759 family integrating conjugative element protein [Klebsiella oxytoca]|nr:TIGR03759 family integrating conjugative element protein [Klebsiella oxytoca]